METIATQVHNKIAQEMITQELLFTKDTLLSKDQSEVYEKILKFGGENVENVKTYLKHKNEDKVITALNSLKNKVAELQLDPRWKVITYGSLMMILKEHNLVMGPLTKYNKEIPEVNAKKMIEYSSCRRTGYVLSSKGYPLFDYNFKSNYENAVRELRGTVDDTHFYICASVDNFEKQYRNRIGQEIFYDSTLKPKFEFEKPNPDPIIISPLIYRFANQQFLLIDVVTSFDREAGLIVNEMEN